MSIDPNVVMWVFGLVFVAFAALVGVIWAQLNRRISVIEANATLDRQHATDVLNRIFDKIDEIKDTHSNAIIATAREFVHKQECQRNHRDKAVQ